MNHIIDRVKGMALAPADEWRKIAGEPIELVPVFTRYVMILAAIPVAASMIWLLFRAPVTAIGVALVTYVVSIVMVFVMAKIIETIAPSFGGQPDADAALKLAAFYPTVGWVAGAANIIPWLGGIVALAGSIYALYTLYLGVPIVMRVPQEKALTFTFAVIGVAILLFFAVGLVTAIIL
jgi:hypothetical protein